MQGNKIYRHVHEIIKMMLTIKAPINTAADNVLKYFLNIFLETIRLDIPCELSTKQMIHMKCQAIFSLKNNNVVCYSFLLGTSMVKIGPTWENKAWHTYITIVLSGRVFTVQINRSTARLYDCWNSTI